MKNVLREYFTLIELLIVIAVIALLAGMLLPALSKCRDVSRLAGCKNNIRQIGTAGGLYSMDFNDFIMSLNHPSSMEDPFTWMEGNNLYNKNASSNIFRCPGLLGKYPGFLADSYGRKNSYQGIFRSIPSNQIPPIMKISSATESSREFFFADASQIQNGQYTCYYARSLSISGAGTIRAYPHPGRKYNITFLDLHAEDKNINDARDPVKVKLDANFTSTCFYPFGD